MDESPAGRAVARFYWLRLTTRGRIVLLITILLALLGLDTLRSRVFVLFALAGAPLVVAGVLMVRRPPRVRLVGELPGRLTAGSRVNTSVRVEPLSGKGSRGSMVVTWPLPRRRPLGIAVDPAETFVRCVPGQPTLLSVAVSAQRRGRLECPGLAVGRTDPFGLLCTAPVEQPARTTLVYPRLFDVDAFPLPSGRRYQPGGIPLASSLGDSSEFASTRDYRPGDPLRRIHWRSWARRGEPVVKEYQEEYFSRLALVLDTHAPARVRAADARAFEAAVSVMGSLASYLSEREEVVDVLVAGSTVYELSAGRSLGSLTQILDVLACVEPSPPPAFAQLEAPLFERLARLTTVVAVLLDWDEAREALLDRIRAMGVALRVVLVTARTPRHVPTLDGRELSVMTPAEVEERLARHSTSGEAA
jgi:uncharacterized protein (DUF58 family)